MKPKKRARMIEEAIRLSYSSLESHLKWTHSKLGKHRDDDETNQFHVNCVKEYARTIYILSRLY